MTKDVRALELYELAQSVLDTKGRFVGVGVLAYKEYRQEHLSIRYWPSTGHIEVWHKRKVLAVNREHGQLKVRHYVPASGNWFLRMRRRGLVLRRRTPLKNWAARRR